MAEWKNITSFSQGDTDRTPRTWEFRAGSLRLVVTRHIHYPDDAWISSCPPLFHEHQLAATDIVAAKEEALYKVRQGVEEILEAIE